jgi:antitoxin MazE
MRTATIKAEQTIQEWGNGLAVRLTAPIARAARLVQGTSVVVEVVNEGVLLRVTGKPKRSLAQKLKAFDPERHGGEVAVSGRVGAEIF